MFKYVSDISILSHYIIEKFIETKDVAIDATLGNGHDCTFLSSIFKKVYAFEVQKEACINYNSLQKDNVIVINDSHHRFLNYIKEDVNCIIYNLGFLPGGNKNITTLANTTLESIKCGLKILFSGGIMAIAIYRGHNAGLEEESVIIEYAKKLPKDTYGVMIHQYLNRSSNSPVLIIIEKK
jgi:hypothetical protein